MGSIHRNGILRRPNDNHSGILRRSNDVTRIITSTVIGVVFGFFVGISFQNFSVTKISLPSSLLSSIDAATINGHRSESTTQSFTPKLGSDENKSSGTYSSGDSSKPFVTLEKEKEPSALTSYTLLFPVDRLLSGVRYGPYGNILENGVIVAHAISDFQIYVTTNPRGAESLPPGIVVSETDFYLRRLWGNPSEDLTTRPKYLLTFTVGFDQRNNINAAVKKFSDDFQIMLFHYDGRTSEWDQFEWSKRAIHVSARSQTKWWYAKRFLHPDAVAAYDYIFIWDEDLGVEHFNAEKYIELVKKHGLEISQPGLEPDKGLTWQMTKRRGDSEVHKETTEKPGWCNDPHLPPCAAFVEIMAPVFSRDAWRCVWHMIQNDLVHGWGLDFALRRCVEPAHEKIGVVDSQWIVHQVIPSLGNQGQADKGKAPWQGVRERCKSEWTMFRNRLADADRAYLEQKGRG